MGKEGREIHVDVFMSGHIRGENVVYCLQFPLGVGGEQFLINEKLLSHDTSQPGPTVAILLCTLYIVCVGDDL